MDKNYKPEPPKKNSQQKSNIFLGVALCSVGFFWILKQSFPIYTRITDIFFSWQMLITLIGVYFLIMRRHVPGIVFSALGCILIAMKIWGISQPLGKMLFPILCVGTGMILLLNQLKNR